MKKREHRLAFIPHLKEVGIPACGRKSVLSFFNLFNLYKPALLVAGERG